MDDSDDDLEWLLRDRTALRYLVKEHRLLKETIEHSPLAFCVYDHEDRLVAWNEAYQQIHPNAGLLLHSSDSDQDISYAMLVRRQLHGSVPEAELDEAVKDRVRKHREADGTPTERHYAAEGWLQVTKYRTPSGAIAGFAQDINALKAREAELEKSRADTQSLLEESRHLAVELQQAQAATQRQADTDPLTGLQNRRGLERMLERRCASPRTALYTLLHADLDFFKQVNDRLGHAAGDHVLAHVAGILRDLTTPRDIAARIGGDEFVLFLEHDDPGRPFELARELIKRVSRPIHYEKQTCCVGTSIGLLQLDQDAMQTLNVDSMLAKSDLALYRSKSGGRNRVVQFGAEMAVQHEHALSLAGQIADAVTSGAIQPWFQPQVDISNWQIVGVEALARWDHETRGLLSPGSFLFTAEKSNLIQLIDDAIADKSFAAMARWRGSGVPIPKVSINLNALHLGRHDLVEQFLLRVERYGIEPEMVTLEILETVLIDSTDTIQAHNISALKRAGFGVQIDDFGTGHAALSTLMNFNLDGLKIDRQFICAIPDDTKQNEIVAAITALTRNIGIEPLAEGVESVRQLDALRSFGCNRFQGYLFAQAMPEERLMGWCSEFLFGGPSWLMEREQAMKIPTAEDTAAG